MTMAKNPYSALEKEQKAFDAMLADLLKEHAGQFVVIKDGEPIGFYQSYGDAYTDALNRYGTDQVFLISEVRVPRAEGPSVSWTTGAMFG